MRRYYEYIFYRLYKWSLNKNGKSDLPQLNALLLLSLITFLHVIILILLIQAILATDFFDRFFSNRLLIIIVAGTNLLLNYCLLFFKGRNKEIIDEFETLDPNIKIKTSYLLAYAIIVIVGFIWLR